MLKKSLLMLVAGILIFGQLPLAAQTDPVTVIAEIYRAGKQVWHFKNVIEGNLWHDWTMCEFESGFRLYNRFKRKRFRNGGKEITDYYTWKGGDCNSFYGAVDGNEHHVCLPRDLNYIISKHGKIKHIFAIKRPPSLKHEYKVSWIDLHNPKKVCTAYRSTNTKNNNNSRRGDNSRW